MGCGSNDSNGSTSTNPSAPGVETWPLARHLDPDHVYFSLFRALLGFDFKDPATHACVVPLVELLLRVYVSGVPAREGQVTLHARKDVAARLKRVAFVTGSPPISNPTTDPPWRSI